MPLRENLGLAGQGMRIYKVKSKLVIRYTMLKDLLPIRARVAASISGTLEKSKRSFDWSEWKEEGPGKESDWMFSSWAIWRITER